jgi:porin
MVYPSPSSPARLAFLLTGIATLPAAGLRADAWTPGLAATLDATSGLSGPGQSRESLHGTALAHLTWQPTPSPESPIAWSAYLSALHVEGRGPTERYLGDFLAISNSEAYASTRLFEWWAEAVRERWSLRAGALLADSEFAGTTPGASLLNSGFGWPAFLSANALNAGPAYYVAALGTRLAYTSETTTWRLGVYDGDSFDSPEGDPHPNRHGTRFELNSAQGAFLITELALAPSGSAQRYLIGAWAHTADFADQAGGPDHSGNHGAYAAIERSLLGQTGEAGNLEAHLRAGLAPDDRNSVAWAADAGLAFTGPIPSRPADTLAYGVVHARLSDRAPGPFDYEQVHELSYTLALGEHLLLQPDLQYIRHPGADPSLDPALVATLRLSLSY